MNKLNVFNTDFCPWRCLPNWPKNFRLFFRQFKWAYQRITKGFCDFDYWDLDTYLIRLMADAIKELADNTHGYPGNEEFPTYEHWKAYLYKIVGKLKYTQEELPNPCEKEWMQQWENKGLDYINQPKTPEEELLSKKYLYYENINAEKQDEALNDALDMIKHVFKHLWD